MTTYPSTTDLYFQNKIAGKKEFDYKYDSSEKTCEHNFFTLAPHQEFVKRFISYNSYYNGLLLYHGLGSGKTCSAIGITEETRKYIKYHKNFKPIIIVASSNVQSNFKLQLFDKHKLEKVKNQWVIHGCLGSSLLEEIGLSHVNELDKSQIIKKIHKLIKKYYVFMGYIEFSNLIDTHNKEALKREFQDRMIVIDEIHNIRTTKEGNEQNDMQKVARHLEYLVTHVKYMKLIFLTGTPMFNGHEEIVFMLNILNLNDKNNKINKSDLFKKNGEFRADGKEKLIAMANGYISYVRGENPYTFPHLIQPKLFEPNRSLLTIPYPNKMYNGMDLTDKIEHLDLYLSEVEGAQKDAYIEKIATLVQKKYKGQSASIDGLNYSEILIPLQCLNIYYGESDEQSGIEVIPMNYKLSGSPKVYHSFEYKDPEHKLFQKDNLAHYSIKMKSILDKLEKADGIILIYSQWIYYGVLPMALCLEELGYKRFGSKTQNLIQNKKGKYSYSIICGNKELSPDIDEDIEALTNHNTNGERVKVVIVSQTGTEGIDLKNVRQVHILEPWYNMNRIEQVIGRARRNCSHKELPDTHKNVQVFLHSCRLDEDIEPLDMYLYRLCERKNTIIGKVSRILKEISVDCLLNESQKDFAKVDGSVALITSEGDEIMYEIKDKPYTNICDYQETCEYRCQCDQKDTIMDNSTYSYTHIMNDQMPQQLKLYFKDRYVYTYDTLKYEMLNLYPFMKDEEFEYAIEKLMSEDVYDKYEERGKIIKIHDLLLFQPYISDYDYISTEERMNPLLYENTFDMEEIHITPTDPLKEFKERVDQDLAKIRATATYKKIKKDETNIFLSRFKDERFLKDLLIEKHFESLPVSDQLFVLNESNQEIRKVLYDTFVVQDKIPLLDETSLQRTSQYYALKKDKWEETDPLSPKEKPNVSNIYGFVKLTGQNKRIQKISFDYKPKQKGTRKVPGEEINTLLKRLTNDPSFYMKENKGVLELCLELWLRHLEKTNPETKYFYYKYEKIGA
jgi:superfamily II DNA or RNA helicase